MPDLTCVDLTSSWGAALAVLVVAGRGALLAIDHFGLASKSPSAKRVADVLGTALGGAAPRGKHAQPDGEA